MSGLLLNRVQLIQKLKLLLNAIALEVGCGWLFSLAFASDPVPESRLA